jgi:hypothetical protein
MTLEKTEMVVNNVNKSLMREFQSESEEISFSFSL